MTISGTLAEPDTEMVERLKAEGLPTEDVGEPGRVFLRFRDEAGVMVGIGGYEPLGNCVLLRSVVVVPERRGLGLGRQITEELMRRAAEGGAHEAYALTSGPKTFLAAIGFEPIQRTEAPTIILETRQARGLCAATAILWRMKITP